MYKTIGKFEPSYLLSDPAGADPIAINCMPGNGAIERGMIMKRENSGMYTPAAAADIVDAKSLVVLGEPVDTNANESVAAAAQAYRAGRFIVSRLLISGGGKLTAENKLVLRKQGILTDIMMDEAEEFNNSTEE